MLRHKFRAMGTEIELLLDADGELAVLPGGGRVPAAGVAALSLPARL